MKNKPLNRILFREITTVNADGRNDAGVTIMVASDVLTMRHEAERLSHRDAAGIAEEVCRNYPAKMILLDLSGTSKTRTAALARLILLRRKLMASGRDLRVTGLTGAAYALYKISRLADLLPHVQCDQE